MILLSPNAVAIWQLWNVWMMLPSKFPHSIKKSYDITVYRWNIAARKHFSNVWSCKKHTKVRSIEQKIEVAGRFILH